MSQIKWSDIEAECGDFRSGFVATFRKYEGQETDEKDAYGRPVKVTVASFARHVGIPKRTFDRWQKGAKQTLKSEDRVRMDTNMARTKARALPPDEKLDLVRELMDDPEVGDQIVEAAEDEGIARRVARSEARDPRSYDEKMDEARRTAEQSRRKMGTDIGHDTDLATDYLRGAANDLANAVYAKETHGIDYPADEADAIAKVEHWLAIYHGAATTADDRTWAESHGVAL